MTLCQACKAQLPTEELPAKPEIPVCRGCGSTRLTEHSNMRLAICLECSVVTEWRK